MESMIQVRPEINTLFHFERSRLNQLFMEAVKYPQVLVCAGAGYGKTSAVHDFTERYEATTLWIQLSERDNVGSRFWENFVHSTAHVNSSYTKAISKIGFPDTRDKLNQYFATIHNLIDKRLRILVLDDFHLIEEQPVIRFIEQALFNLPVGTSLFLLSRSMPYINTAGRISKGQMYSISEDALRFTECELSQYFRRQEINLPSQNLREIMDDTGGWVFAINLIARSYQKAPGYEGYIRNAMKINIFELMETEIWNKISPGLQCFLVRLSLIDHLSVDLISILAKDNEELMAELDRQNAYVRRDNYINAYLIHHLFLEFLRQKQDFLSEEQKRETYEIAGEWCNKNGFKIDALSYYEKAGDYKSLVSIIFEFPAQIPQDVASYASKMFSRFPAEFFDKEAHLAVMHIRVIVCQGLWKEAFELIKQYEAKYLKRPVNEPFRNIVLGGIYYYWGIVRTLMSTIDDCYDFDVYFAKQDGCLSIAPADPGPLANHPVGPWISLVGSSRKGAPEDFIEATKRVVKHISHCFNGAMTGFDDLAQGELQFYQDDIHSAETFINIALRNAQDHEQYEVVHRALLYTMRIAVYQGNYSKAEQALKDMEAQLDKSNYTYRYVTFDIARAWYYYILCLPDMVPDWLKDNFEQYGHACFLKNFANQAKARYCYMVKNYPVLLTYIHRLKQRESILFGRLEMLAMEACIHYKLKNRAEAFAVLYEAYETALPNNILMPFIELGKDMRTLTSSALKEPNNRIPKSWLGEVNRKAASYAKRQAHVIAEYKQSNYPDNNISLSTREREILTDLSHGLSRTEIAASRNLSVNTVKMVINFIYTKLGAENLADLIRIAAEKKMI